MTTTGRARPGGRTARTRDAVHAAVRELIAESGSEHVVITDVAARSGVHAATIYRRWGRPELLVLDVAVDRLRTELPVPATGDLAADLLCYARMVAEDLTRPGGLAFLRAVLAASAVPTEAEAAGEAGEAGEAGVLEEAGEVGETGEVGAAGETGEIGVAGEADGVPGARSLIERRLEDFQVMLDRAGPAAGDLTALDVVDGILAPLYLRLLFGGAGSIEDSWVRRLVTKLMRQAAAS